MKKFETLNHTADIGGRVYGKDITELFINAAKLLYFLSGAVISSKGEGNLLKIKTSGGNVEELLVRFLNELIYFMDVKKIAGKIKKLSIQNEKDMLILECKIEMKEVSITREIKAATYHNLKIRKETDGLSTDIIFDI